MGKKKGTNGVHRFFFISHESALYDTDLKSFSFADSIILSSATHLLHIALIKIKDICNSNRILIAKSILKNKEMLR